VRCTTPAHNSNSLLATARNHSATALPTAITPDWVVSGYGVSTSVNVLFAEKNEASRSIRKSDATCDSCRCRSGPLHPPSGLPKPVVTRGGTPYADIPLSPNHSQHFGPQTCRLHILKFAASRSRDIRYEKHLKNRRIFLFLLFGLVSHCP
jgi:hypothetical protein